MQTLIEWLSMGGYASYVWPAYGAVVFVFVIHVISCRWQKRRIESALKTWFKQMAR